MSGMFWGYERPDGTVGIRNHVAVVSVMDNCNPVTRAVRPLIAPKRAAHDATFLSPRARSASTL